MLEHRIGVQMSPVQWRSHVELLQSFTEAAEQAACSQEQAPVGGHTSAVLVAGSQPLSLNLPTVLPIPDVIPPEIEQAVEKEVQIAPSEEKSVDSFYSLTDEVENHETVATKDGPSPIPEEDQSQPPVSPRYQHRLH